MKRDRTGTWFGGTFEKGLSGFPALKQSHRCEDGGDIDFRVDDGKV